MRSEAQMEGEEIQAEAGEEMKVNNLIDGDKAGVGFAIGSWK